MSEKKDYEEVLRTMDSEKAIQNMDKHYSDKKFWNKLKKFGKKAGQKTVYYSLLLFYTAKDPRVPNSSKMIIVGALGYLIFPVDLIPDFIPVVGLADDATVIAAAVYKVVQHIDDEIKNKTKQKYSEFFGDTSAIEI
ncbi:YkvA family protein [Sporosarcina sp. 6E9]|uniref:YkvA family protein n=1 Tax=Sporosarcina sp. 6E9 TaxID=2819235 RepID=UPI001B313257|nr:YkvA family protein [Sporosarcina sp. 6E9]